MLAIALVCIAANINVVAASTVTQSTTITPYPTTGLPHTVIVQSGATDTSQTLESDYTYDAYGNAIQVDAKGCVWTSPTVCSATTRTTKAAYDLATYHAAFPTGTTNALNQNQSAAFDLRFGTQTSATDLNGLATTTTVDTLGRPTLVTATDGTKTSISYAYCSGINGGTATCPTSGAYTVTSTPQTSAGAQNGPITVVYFDKLSRVIAQDTQGQDSSWIRVATQYDARGRVSQTSRPYFVTGGTPKWTVNTTYDALDRVTLITYPDMSHSTYAYHGLSTSVTNDKAQTTTTVRNAQGLIASVLDAASQTTSFNYDAIGDLISAHDPAGNIASAIYDPRGRMTSMSNPDRGTWTYLYSSYGEMDRQTDAKAQVTTVSYDAVGRPLSRTETGMSSSWTYDTALHGKGLLASTTNGAGFTQTEVYDTFSRPSTNTIAIDGTNHVYTTTYLNGRIDTLAYPSGFAAKYVYTLGYLSQIKDNASGSSIWTGNTRDAEQNLLTQTAGNGVATTQVFDSNTGAIKQIQAGPTNVIQNRSYTWDTIGNLTSRTDSNQAYTETFGYDSLNRLTSSQAGTFPARTIDYNPAGNITKKTDICGTANCFTYGASAGAHALTGIVGTYNGITNPTFTYDANGNLLAGGGRALTWTSFNMASTITQSAVSLALIYDSAHNRLKACMPNCTAPASSTFYLGDDASGTLSEKVVSGATTTWHDYVTTEAGIVAERFNVAGAVSWRYFALDHLGSTVALTDASGVVQEQLSYDPWGRRRNTNGSDNPTCSITSATSRGFTGHEMIDTICMINMNARVYDPSLGRFTSADGIQPGTDNGQAQNGYSYVNNGPLSATDPTGQSLIPQDGGCFDCSFTSQSGFGGSGLNPFTSSCNITAPGRPCWSDWDIIIGPSGSKGSSGTNLDTGSRGNGPTGGGGKSGTSSSVVSTSLDHTVDKGGFCRLIPRPRGVTMASISGSVTIPFFPKSISLNVGFGIAVSPSGNIAIPVFGFAGGARGTAQSLTANFTRSNAKNFTDFGGAFAEGGTVGGIGGGGGFAKFAGANSVQGTTYSLGEVTGLSVFAGASYTDIGPSIDLNAVAGCQ